MAIGGTEVVTRLWMEVSGKHHASASLPPGTTPIRIKQGEVWPQSWSGRLGEDNFLPALAGLRTLDSSFRFLGSYRFRMW